MAEKYAFPKGSTNSIDRVEPDGGRIVNFDDGNGNHHQISVDRKGDAIEDITKDGKQAGHRHFHMEFDGHGNRIETAEEKHTDGSTTTISQTYDSHGTISESSESTLTPGKTAEYPTRLKRTTTEYGENHRLKRKVEEDIEYMDQDLTGNYQPTKGRRTTTMYKANGDPDHTETDHFDPQTGTWLKDK